MTSGDNKFPTNRDGTKRDLAEEIADLAHRLSAGNFELLVLIGEAEVTDAWVASGSLSCASWLADLCGVELSTARSQLRVARAMREYPRLHELMAMGEISYAKARMVVPHLSAENSDELLEICTETSLRRLGVALAMWLNRHEDPEALAERQFQARSVSWRTNPDGMVTITAHLPPLMAAQVCAVVDQVVAGSDAPVGASLGQQRADALVDAINTGGGAVDTEIIVHVRGDGNTMADGTPISDHDVASLLPDAFVSLLIHDSKRYPIDASPRRRTPIRRQKRVIDERYKECASQGCTGTQFLQYDHKVPRARQGPTSLDNLQKLCGPHNRAKWLNDDSRLGGSTDGSTDGPTDGPTDEPKDLGRREHPE